MSNRRNALCSLIRVARQRPFWPGGSTKLRFASEVEGMVSHGLRRRFAGAGARRIGAYLRMLSGRGRNRPEGLCSLRDELAPRLRGVVADAIGVDAVPLVPTVSPRTDLAFDSLDLLELAGRIEDAFDVTLPERELGSVTTFGDMLAVVTALVACRMRAREAAPSALELRVGDGTIP